MRVLVSLEGSREGGTRAAIGRLSFDHLCILASDPEAEAVERVRRLADSLGADVTIEPVPGSDLLAAFEVIRETLVGFEEESRLAQINAGPDANLLSAAGMLACLHEGVPMHFLHEEGHTPLPVLTRAPLGEMLGERETDQLVAMPEAGIALDRTDEHDEWALNKLKDHGLIEREGSLLVLTDLGRSYREHQDQR